MEIKQMIEDAHENAIEKGWWDKEPTFGELIALCHSELSEALEDFRRGEDADAISIAGQDKKPVGIPIELADVIIRIADLCGHYGIDLEAAIKEKMEYNKGRSWRHGGKKL